MDRPYLLSEKSPTILVVDDDASVRDLVTYLLEMDGYKVLKAKHSQEALLFEEEFSGPIHLLLTDFCMRPHPNGCELANRVRHHRPGIPVLYMSGYVEDDSLQQDLESSQAAFLSKPFSPSGLLECVRKMLRVHA